MDEQQIEANQDINDPVETVTREHEVKGRPVSWHTLGGVGYAIFDEPVYRDRVYIDKNETQFDYSFDMQGTGANLQAVPRLNSFESNARSHLVFVRAVAAWTLSVELNEDNLQDLVPLRVHDALMEIIFANDAWKKLGEESNQNQG